MKRLIIVGSPRTNGRSAHLAEMLFEANIDEHPEDELFLVPLSEVEVGPCIACDACRDKLPVTFKDDAGNEVTEERHRCVFDDDMQTIYDLLEDVDEVSVVSPVYFSGAPAQMKCLIDRLQPYYWRLVETRATGEKTQKRPLKLHVIGDGGDSHGYDALVSEVKSAFATAGFRLESILDWVGKISEDGEITAEAREITFDSKGEKERPKLSLSSSKGGRAEAGQPGGKKDRPKPDQAAGKKGRAKSGQSTGKGSKRG